MNRKIDKNGVNMFNDENIKVVMEIENIKTSNWLYALRGMRNPLQSYHKSDSKVEMNPYSFYNNLDYKEIPTIGENDYKLATTLSKAGASHSKFLRQIGIICNVKAPAYWWTEFDTYKIGTVSNSTSKMFTLGKRELTKKDFAFDFWVKEDEVLLEYINDLINILMHMGKTNINRFKQIWRKLQQIIPSSFIYTKTISMNYAALQKMYKDRRNHKLKEWRVFLDKLIKSIPYGNDFITNNK